MRNAIFAFLAATSLLLANETPPTDTLVRKAHTMQINNKSLAYESVVGTLTTKGDDQKAKADIFFTAYFATTPAATNRPITFCFNGGPGASSIWLHMGFLGPKRIIFHDLQPNPPPSSYEDNPYTLLESSDLVFVDPVGTGCSKAADGVENKAFFGVDGDIDSLAEFIRLFLAKFERFNSPKFLLGESYGTLRVVGLAEKLHSTYYIDVNGLVLVSSILDFGTANFDDANELSYIFGLPTYAATSWYHKQLSPALQKKQLQELLAEVEEFATHDYATALLQGDKLDDAHKQQIAERIATYTGLPASFVLQGDLRIPYLYYAKRLLAAQKLVVGRFDSRATGYDLQPLLSLSTYDPSFDGTGSCFTTAFMQYLQADLGWTNDAFYRTLNGAVINAWNFSPEKSAAGIQLLNVAPNLADLIVKTPSLKVFIASGYYDLAIPYFGTDYTIDHLRLPAPLRPNIAPHYYEAGHMMYLNPPSLVHLKTDLTEFVADTLK